MNAFVSTIDHTSEQDLVRIIKDLTSETDPPCYFLRWPHKVSGFQTQQPTGFPGPEGQMFDHRQELRWKQQGSANYSILLLSLDQPLIKRFNPLEGRWKAQDRKAHVYPTEVTRFPRQIHHGNVNIAQRYFVDDSTATVHFVALTLEG